MAQLGDGQRRDGAAEVLAQKPAIEVADKNAIDVAGLQASRGDGSQGDGESDMVLTHGHGVTSLHSRHGMNCPIIEMRKW